jgi:hypothetical protein
MRLRQRPRMVAWAALAGEASVDGLWRSRALLSPRTRILPRAVSFLRAKSVVYVPI